MFEERESPHLGMLAIIQVALLMSWYSAIMQPAFVPCARLFLKAMKGNCSQESLNVHSNTGSVICSLHG